MALLMGAMWAFILRRGIRFLNQPGIAALLNGDDTEASGAG